MTSDEPSWQQIRLLRAEPPARASNGKRRRVFRAALEQAEEYFVAARRSSLATRPVYAFYGASQGARAVLAAHATDEQWTGRGHGLRSRQTDGPLAHATAQNEDSGLFRSLASTLRSPTLPEAVEFAELFAALPAVIPYSLLPNSILPTPLVLVPHSYNSGFGGRITRATSALAWGLPYRLLESGDDRFSVSTYLADFPTLGDWVLQERSEGRLHMKRDEDAWGTQLTWTMLDSAGSDATRHQFVQRHALTPPHTGDPLYAPPKVGVAAEAMAPLVNWWALLHLLSIVARYEPDRWRSEINVDESASAVALEAMLNAAVHDVPGHLLQALVNPTCWRADPA